MPFRQSDLRRVQTLFDAAVTAPYEAVAALSADAMALSVSVEDPGNPGLAVVSCRFDFDTSRKMSRQPQPSETETAAQAAMFETLCTEYVPPAP